MKLRKKRLIAVHMLNDFSGSPMVLKQALQVLKEDFDIHLYTSTPSGKGVLSDLEGVCIHSIFYKWDKNKLLTLAYYTWAQICLFWTLLIFLKRRDTVYVNTLLPFSAALAGRCVGSKVIYHIHEVSIKPALFKLFLVKVANICAYRLCFVSHYVKGQFHFSEEKTTVIYNALPDSFLKKAQQVTICEKNARFTVLMLCSAKAYKGIYEFVEIAKVLYFIDFELVLSTSSIETDSFKRKTNVPDNCRVYPVQEDTSKFYRRADLIVNLSKPDQWIETFGMTILEGMVYGLPSVVPAFGGVTELVENGVEGLQVNPNNRLEVIQAITKLSTNRYYYIKLSHAAKQKAEFFSQYAFRSKMQLLFRVSDQKVEGLPTGILFQEMELDYIKNKLNN
jgi:glycosyltransferase involved in cell wall biosynthesis